LNGWEYLGGILESDRTFTERICDRKEIDEEDDGTDLGGLATAGVQEGETGRQQEDTHERERLVVSDL